MLSLFGPRRQPRVPRNDLIARLCRESGRWMIAEREADLYQVRAINDHKPTYYVQIRYSPTRPNLVLQSFFPVSFSLENPPSGLFARLLLRSVDLSYGAWKMNIDGRCETGLYVAARLPQRAIDARLFDSVCRELVDEIDAFDTELRGKFRYGGNSVVPGRVVSTSYTPPGVPEVVFIEPVQHHIGQMGHRQLPDQRG